MARGFEFRTRRTRTLYPLEGVLSAAAQYASTLFVVTLLLLPFAHAAALRFLVATMGRGSDGNPLAALEAT